MPNQPAGGPDTAWRPGFMAGSQLALRNLGSYVAGNGPTREETLERIQSHTHDPEWRALVAGYRELVRATIPAA